MTDSEFEAMIDAAKARLSADIEKSFAKVKVDTHASFREAYKNMNQRFDAAAKDLGISLNKTSTLLSEAAKQDVVIYDDGESSFGYRLTP